MNTCWNFQHHILQLSHIYLHFLEFARKKIQNNQLKDLDQKLH